MRNGPLTSEGETTRGACTPKLGQKWREKSLV